MDKSFIIYGLFVCFFLLSAAFGAYGGGTGDPCDPYQIWDAEQLNYIGINPLDWSKSFILMDDIFWAEINGPAAGIIGEVDPAGTHFSGTFDGNGHRIFNFCDTSDMSASYGLFGTVTENAVIKNLTLVESDTLGPSLATFNYGKVINCDIKNGSVYGEGALVEFNYGTIRNCHVDIDIQGDQPGGLAGSNEGIIKDSSARGTVTADYCAGGLVSLSIGDNAVIENCLADCNIEGAMLVGGLVGINKGTINKCFSKAEVSGGSTIGGLVGKNTVNSVGYPAYISDSYSICTVNGQDSIGGLTGRNNGEVVNCYAAGDVDGSTDVGGLIGISTAGSSVFYENCFWDSDINPGLEGIGKNESSEPETNVTGLPTENLQDFDTFTAAGWDLIGETSNGSDDIWIMTTGKYPRFVFDADSFMLDIIKELQTYWLAETDILCDYNPDGIVNFADLELITDK